MAYDQIQTIVEEDKNSVISPELIGRRAQIDNTFANRNSNYNFDFVPEGSTGAAAGIKLQRPINVHSMSSINEGGSISLDEIKMEFGDVLSADDADIEFDDISEEDM